MTTADTLKKQGVYSFTAGSEDRKKRLDMFLTEHISTLSRNHIASLIQAGHVHINNQVKKPGYKVHCGDDIVCHVPEASRVEILPSDIPLDILYETSDYLLLNKKPGQVVHPAPGHYEDTIVNGLLWRFPSIKDVGCADRPGIVHRLDKDTSGALLIAKTNNAYRYFSDLFASRSIYKEYTALLIGSPTEDSGTIELPIGRHPRQRKMMSIHSNNPKNAISRWFVQERYADDITRVRFVIATGRTHQIRVHAKAIGHPVAGDPVYKYRKRRPLKGLSIPHRQMLHAEKICFTYGDRPDEICHHVPLPDDMRLLIDKLRSTS